MDICFIIYNETDLVSSASSSSLKKIPWKEWRRRTSRLSLIILILIQDEEEEEEEMKKETDPDHPHILIQEEEEEDWSWSSSSVPEISGLFGCCF